MAARLFRTGDLVVGNPPGINYYWVAQVADISHAPEDIRKELNLQRSQFRDAILLRYLGAPSFEYAICDDDGVELLLNEKELDNIFVPSTGKYRKPVLRGVEEMQQLLCQRANVGPPPLLYAIAAEPQQKGPLDLLDPRTWPAELLQRALIPPPGELTPQECASTSAAGAVAALRAAAQSGAVPPPDVAWPRLVYSSRARKGRKRLQGLAACGGTGSADPRMAACITAGDPAAAGPAAKVVGPAVGLARNSGVQAIAPAVDFEVACAGTAVQPAEEAVLKGDERSSKRRRHGEGTAPGEGHKKEPAVAAVTVAEGPSSRPTSATVASIPAVGATAATADTAVAVSAGPSAAADDAAAPQASCHQPLARAPEPAVKQKRKSQLEQQQERSQQQKRKLGQQMEGSPQPQLEPASAHQDVNDNCDDDVAITRFVQYIPRARVGAQTGDRSDQAESAANRDHGREPFPPETADGEEPGLLLEPERLAGGGQGAGMAPLPAGAIGAAPKGGDDMPNMGSFEGATATTSIVAGSGSGGEFDGAAGEAATGATTCGGAGDAAAHALVSGLGVLPASRLSTAPGVRGPAAMGKVEEGARSVKEHSSSADGLSRGRWLLPKGLRPVPISGASSCRDRIPASIAAADAAATCGGTEGAGRTSTSTSASDADDHKHAMEAAMAEGPVGAGAVVASAAVVQAAVADTGVPYVAGNVTSGSQESAPGPATAPSTGAAGGTEGAPPNGMLVPPDGGSGEAPTAGGPSSIALPGAAAAATAVVGAAEGGSSEAELTADGGAEHVHPPAGRGIRWQTVPGLPHAVRGFRGLQLPPLAMPAGTVAMVRQLAADPMAVLERQGRGASLVDMHRFAVLNLVRERCFSRTHLATRRELGPRSVRLLKTSGAWLEEDAEAAEPTAGAATAAAGRSRPAKAKSGPETGSRGAVKADSASFPTRGAGSAARPSGTAQPDTTARPSTSAAGGAPRPTSSGSGPPKAGAPGAAAASTKPAALDGDDDLADLELPLQRIVDVTSRRKGSSGGGGAGSADAMRTQAGGPGILQHRVAGAGVGASIGGRHLHSMVDLKASTSRKPAGAGTASATGAGLSAGLPGAVKPKVAGQAPRGPPRPSPAPPMAGAAADTGAPAMAGPAAEVAAGGKRLLIWFGQGPMPCTSTMDSLLEALGVEPSNRPPWRMDYTPGQRYAYVVLPREADARRLESSLRANGSSLLKIPSMQNVQVQITPVEAPLQPPWFQQTQQPQKAGTQPPQPLQQPEQMPQLPQPAPAWGLKQAVGGPVTARLPAAPDERGREGATVKLSAKLPPRPAPPSARQRAPDAERGRPGRQRNAPPEPAPIFEPPAAAGYVPLGASGSRSRPSPGAAKSGAAEGKRAASPPQLPSHPHAVAPTPPFVPLYDLPGVQYGQDEQATPWLIYSPSRAQDHPQLYSPTRAEQQDAQEQAPQQQERQQQEAQHQLEQQASEGERQQRLPPVTHEQHLGTGKAAGIEVPAAAMGAPAGADSLLAPHLSGRHPRHQEPPPAQQLPPLQPIPRSQSLDDCANLPAAPGPLPGHRMDGLGSGEEQRDGAWLGHGSVTSGITSGGGGDGSGAVSGRGGCWELPSLSERERERDPEREQERDRERERDWKRDPGWQQERDRDGARGPVRRRNRSRSRSRSLERDLLRNPELRECYPSRAKGDADGHGEGRHERGGSSGGGGAGSGSRGPHGAWERDGRQDSRPGGAGRGRLNGSRSRSRSPARWRRRPEALDEFGGSRSRDRADDDHGAAADRRSRERDHGSNRDRATDRYKPSSVGSLLPPPPPLPSDPCLELRGRGQGWRGRDREATRERDRSRERERAGRKRSDKLRHRDLGSNRQGDPSDCLLDSADGAVRLPGRRSPSPTRRDGSRPQQRSPAALRGSHTSSLSPSSGPEQGSRASIDGSRAPDRQGGAADPGGRVERSTSSDKDDSAAADAVAGLGATGYATGDRVCSLSAESSGGACGAAAALPRAALLQMGADLQSGEAYVAVPMAVRVLQQGALPPEVALATAGVSVLPSAPGASQPASAVPALSTPQPPREAPDTVDNGAAAAQSGFFYLPAMTGTAAAATAPAAPLPTTAGEPRVITAAAARGAACATQGGAAASPNMGFTAEPSATVAAGHDVDVLLPQPQQPDAAVWQPQAQLEHKQQPCEQHCWAQEQQESQESQEPQTLPVEEEQMQQQAHQLEQWQQLSLKVQQPQQPRVAEQAGAVDLESEAADLKAVAEEEEAEVEAASGAAQDDGVEVEAAPAAAIPDSQTEAAAGAAAGMGRSTLSLEQLFGRLAPDHIQLLEIALRSINQQPALEEPGPSIDG